MNLKTIFMPLTVSVMLTGCLAPQGGTRSSLYRYTTISRAGGYRSGGVFMLRDGRVLYDKGGRRYFSVVASEPAVPMEQAPVPDLITVLQDPSAVAALWAADALGADGAAAKNAVPALTVVLNAKYPFSGAYGVIDTDVQRAAARALGAIGAGAASALVELDRIAADTGRDAELREAAKQAAAKIGPRLAGASTTPTTAAPQAVPIASVPPAQVSIVDDGADVKRAENPLQPIEELKGALIHSLHPKELPIDSVTFSTDGKWLAVGKEGFTPKHSRYTLFASDAGTRCSALDEREPQFGQGVATISPDSSTLALSAGHTNDEQHINIYSISGWSLGQTITKRAVSSCTFWWMPDGKSLLLQEADGSMTSPKSGASISLVDVSSGNCIWNLQTKGPVMAISREGRYVLCATGSPKGGAAHTQGYPVQIITVQQPTNITEFLAHKEWIADLAVSPDSKTLASGGADKLIKLWSLPEGKLLHTFEGHEWTVNALRFTPDGKTLVSGGEDCTIRFWDVDSKAPMGKISLSNAPVTAIDVAPDGRTIALGTGRLVSVCNYAKLRELAIGKHIEHPLNGN